MKDLEYRALTWKGRTRAVVDCLDPATANAAICSIGWFEEDVQFAESVLLGILLVGDDTARDCAMIGLTHLAQRTRGQLGDETQVVLKKLVGLPASSARATDTLSDVRAFRKAAKSKAGRSLDDSQ